MLYCFSLLKSVFLSFIPSVYPVTFHSNFSCPENIESHKEKLTSSALLALEFTIFIIVNNTSIFLHGNNNVYMQEKPTWFSSHNVWLVHQLILWKFVTSECETCWLGKTRTRTVCWHIYTWGWRTNASHHNTLCSHARKDNKPLFIKWSHEKKTVKVWLYFNIIHTPKEKLQQNMPILVKVQTVLTVLFDFFTIFPVKPILFIVPKTP